jgi:hypothetical protein
MIPQDREKSAAPSAPSSPRSGSELASTWNPIVTTSRRPHRYHRPGHHRTRRHVGERAQPQPSICCGCRGDSSAPRGQPQRRLLVHLRPGDRQADRRARPTELAARGTAHHRHHRRRQVRALRSVGSAERRRDMASRRPPRPATPTSPRCPRSGHGSTPRKPPSSRWPATPASWRTPWNASPRPSNASATTAAARPSPTCRSPQAGRRLRPPAAAQQRPPPGQPHIPGRRRHRSTHAPRLGGRRRQRHAEAASVAEKDLRPGRATRHPRQHLGAAHGRCHQLHQGSRDASRRRRQASPPPWSSTAKPGPPNSSRRFCGCAARKSSALPWPSASTADAVEVTTATRPVPPSNSPRPSTGQPCPDRHRPV